MPQVLVGEFTDDGIPISGGDAAAAAIGALGAREREHRQPSIGLAREPGCGLRRSLTFGRSAIENENVRLSAGDRHDLSTRGRTSRVQGFLVQPALQR
jgi:hypothetical protein